MVDHGSLVLPVLGTPGTVGLAHKVPKGIRAMDPLESHDLLEIPWWVPPLRILTLWVVIEENSWPVLTPLVPSRTAVFHGWI